MIDAGESIVIKTGDASITMKKDGTIIIKGKDITIRGQRQDQHKGRRRHRDEGIEDQAELRTTMANREPARSALELAEGDEYTRLRGVDRRADWR